MINLAAAKNLFRSSVLHTKPVSFQSIKASGLKLAPQIEQDTLVLTKKTINQIKTNEADITKFADNFLASNQQNEEILRTFDFAKYGKEGLPLKYSRENFVQDLKNAIKNHSEEEQKAILKKFNLEMLDDLEGLGIIPQKLNTKEEKELASIIENYTLKNEFLLNDKNEKSFFDSIIKGVPEFLSSIGKKQHPTHSYDVSNHTFINLQNMLKNPAYEKLSEKDKALAKMSMLLHDLGKKGDIVDTGHSVLSKEYSKDILPKYAKQFTKTEQQRIINQVENHHWFENYNNQQTTANQVLDIFKTKEDLEIAKIMAKADLEGVSPRFHHDIMYTQNQAEFDNKMKKILDCIDKPENTLNKNFSPEDIRIAKYTDEEWAKYEKIFEEAESNEINTLFAPERYDRAKMSGIFKDLKKAGINTQELKSADIKEQAKVINEQCGSTLNYFPELNADVNKILSGKKVCSLDTETAQELVKRLDIENLDFNKFPLYRKEELLSLLETASPHSTVINDIEKKFDIVKDSLSCKGVKRPHNETVKKYIPIIENDNQMKKMIDEYNCKFTDVTNDVIGKKLQHNGNIESIKKEGINLDYCVNDQNSLRTGFYTAPLNEQGSSAWYDSDFIYNGLDSITFKLKPSAKIFEVLELESSGILDKAMESFAKKHKLSTDEYIILQKEMELPYFIKKAKGDGACIQNPGFVADTLCIYNPDILTMIK